MESVGGDWGGKTMEKGGVVGTQVGGVMAVFGGLTLNEWLAIGGFLLACASFLFQVFVTLLYKERHYRLAVARLERSTKEHKEEDGEHD